jgi:hypothetical protein
MVCTNHVICSVVLFLAEVASGFNIMSYVLEFLINLKRNYNRMGMWFPKVNETYNYLALVVLAVKLHWLDKFCYIGRWPIYILSGTWFMLNVFIFFCVSSVKSALILLPFLIVVQHESGTRKNIYWSATYITKFIQSMQFDC